VEYLRNFRPNFVKPYVWAVNESLSQ
jgi:hypothetical protein